MLAAFAAAVTRPATFRQQLLPPVLQAAAHQLLAAPSPSPSHPSALRMSAAASVVGGGGRVGHLGLRGPCDQGLARSLVASDDNHARA